MLWCGHWWGHSSSCHLLLGQVLWRGHLLSLLGLLCQVVGRDLLLGLHVERLQPELHLVLRPDLLQAEGYVLQLELQLLLLPLQDLKHLKTGHEVLLLFDGKVSCRYVCVVCVCYQLEMGDAGD